MIDDLKGKVISFTRSFFLAKKNRWQKCSNFFVFQSCELRFSGILCLYLKPPFPGSFEFRLISGGVPTTIYKHENIKLEKTGKKHTFFNSVVGSYPGVTSGGIIARNERIRTVAFQNIKKNKNRISIGEDTAPQRRLSNRGILTSTLLTPPLLTY